MTKVILACIICAVYVVFYMDNAFIFECREETRRYEYFRSTLKDPEMKLLRTYDISQATEVKIKRHSKRKKKDSYYTNFINTQNGGFEIPYYFSARKVKKELDRINDFVSGREQSYRFEELTVESVSGFYIYLLIFMIFTPFLLGCMICDFNLWNGSKERER